MRFAVSEERLFYEQVFYERVFCPPPGARRSWLELVLYIHPVTLDKVALVCYNTGTTKTKEKT